MRARFESELRFVPSNETIPRVGVSRPANKCNSVDFPLPLGPAQPTISPRSMLMVTSSSAVTVGASEEPKLSHEPSSPPREYSLVRSTQSMREG